MQNMPDADKETVIRRYSERYKKFGYSPKSLGWDKGKQDLRYDILLEEFDLENKSILDIGCGFGDANKSIRKRTKNYKYLGVDIVEDLIIEAKKQYSNNENINFRLEDFLMSEIEEEYDIAVSSGVFNFKLQNGDNYQFINAFMRKAFSIVKEGLAFDFLSDKVDFQYEYTFHSSPSKIIEMGYELSRNIVLKNNYMPFEFALVVFKDDTFEKEDTIFKRYKNEKQDY